MMKSELRFLFSGIIFGLSGGLSPGPLLTLVVSETLKHGVREGIKIAVAPLLTDVPIILAAFFIISSLSDTAPVIGGIYLCGGVFLSYLAYESISFRGADTDIREISPQSLRKGIIANLLNPSPYLFWISIGSTTVLKALEISLLSAIFFLVSFYLSLVGAKILLAILIGKSRFFLKSRHYIRTIRGLGILLLIFAIIFFRDGLTYLFY